MDRQWAAASPRQIDLHQVDPVFTQLLPLLEKLLLAFAGQFVRRAEELNDRDEAAAGAHVADFDVSFGDFVKRHDYRLGSGNTFARRRGRRSLPPPALYTDIRNQNLADWVSGLHEDPFLNTGPQIWRKLRLQLIASVDNQARVHISPVLLQVGVHSWKGAWHELISSDVAF